MPCATVHLHLADRILVDWEEGKADPPIAFRRPELRAAFLHGALAPDMGFIPGVDRFASEFAHYLAPADLTRALLRSASDEEGQAFALGWATHVLADVEIHPIIGRGVGEKLYGDRSRRIDAQENVAEHVSLEIGLDICVLMESSRDLRPPESPRFDSDRARQMESAFRDVYGLRWDRSHLLRMNRQAMRLTRWWPRTLRILASGWKGGEGVDDPAGAAAYLFGRMRSLTSEGSATRGFFRPRFPPAWLREEVGRALELLPGRFHALVAGRLEEMENRNLETGGEAGPGWGHPASDHAARKLMGLLAIS